RNDRKHPPQVVAVVEFREKAVLGIAAEAVEGAEGHVLGVRGPRWGPPQSFAGQLHEAHKIALPKLLGGFRVAFLDRPQPARDGTLWRHDASPAGVEGFNSPTSYPGRKGQARDPHDPRTRGSSEPPDERPRSASWRGQVINQVHSRFRPAGARNRTVNFVAP